MSMHASPLALFLLIAAAAWAAPQAGQDSASRDAAPPGIAVAGHIRNPAVHEASGLARSLRRPDRLWLLNDGGWKPALYAVGTDGEDHGSVLIRGAKNVDWEDLAAFEQDGRPWLLIADTGDNTAARASCVLYIVEEPADPLPAVTRAARSIRFRYPDGPRDAEAVAADVPGDSILILSKRDIPAVLYRVPLSATSGDVPIVAERVGEVASIPQPSARDLERALPDRSWHWQPTALDISADGRLAVVMTYRAAYLYTRAAGTEWIDVLRSTPLRYDLGGIALAEAITFAAAGDSLFVTVEGRRPQLYRIDNVNADRE